MSGQWVNVDDDTKKNESAPSHRRLVDYINMYGIMLASIHIGMNCGIIGGILAYAGFSFIEAIVTISCMSKDEMSSVLSSGALGNEKEKREKIKVMTSKYLPQATCAVFIAYLIVRMLLKF